MNSIVERLRDADERGVAPPQNWTTVCADLIEQQAERIKELEETLETSRAAAESYELRLAALRQRIDDAPVVAEVEKERGLTYGNRGAAAVGTKLISKEDLL